MGSGKLQSKRLELGGSHCKHGHNCLAVGMVLRELGLLAIAGVELILEQFRDERRELTELAEQAQRVS